jgi:hypothetical protein
MNEHNVVDIKKNRQIAYNIFNIIETKIDTRMSEDFFTSSNVNNPSDDRKVTIGALKYETSLTNTDIQEIISDLNINPKIFYNYLTGLEKTINDFFEKNILNIKSNESQSALGITNDIDLDDINKVDEKNPTFEEETKFELDLVDFTSFLLQSKNFFIEKEIEEEIKIHIISLNKLTNYWRLNTPIDMEFEEFKVYLKSYKLETEEKIFLKSISINEEEFFIVNNQFFILNQKNNNEEEEEDEEDNDDDEDDDDDEDADEF